MDYSERAEAILNSSYSDDYDKNPLKINALTFSAEYIVKGNELDFHVCFNEQSRLLQIVEDSKLNREFINLLRNDKHVKTVTTKEEMEYNKNASVIFVDVKSYDEKEFVSDYFDVNQNKIQLIIILEEQIMPGTQHIEFEEYGYMYLCMPIRV